MSLVFNNVIIPENVANVLHFNGNNIERVIFNGIEVWLQSLYTVPVWSGSSLAWHFNGSVGISTSGNLCASVMYGATSATWIEIVEPDIFTAASSSVSNNGGTQTITSYGTGLLSVTGNVNASFSYDRVTGFSQESGGGAEWTYQVSAGQLRVVAQSTQAGAWITLN